MNGSDVAEPTVIFEDQELLVANKPAHVVCHSAKRPEHPTLVGWLRKQGIEIPRLVNRLDRETSGLVIVAKNERAAKLLAKELQRGGIRKVYIAICCGEFRPERGIIDQPIGLDPDSVVYTKRRVDENAGRPSVTEFCLERRLQGFSVVRLIPQTGRTHQLRVHMAWLGHSIVGDKIYGPDAGWYLRFIKEGITQEMIGQLFLSRHALHAGSLSLLHPTTRERIEFCAPIPSDMLDFIGKYAVPGTNQNSDG